MAETKRTNVLVDCPKCGVPIVPIILEFIKGTDQVTPAIPDRNHVRCPLDACRQNFYVRADDGLRTDGKAVMERERAAHGN